MKNKPTSLIGKALWILQHRPTAFLSNLRGYFLFWVTGTWIRLLTRAGMVGDHLRLGKNVRIQKWSSLHAEKPNAKIIIGDHSIVYENADIGAYDSSTIEIGQCAVIGDLRVSSRIGVKMGHRFICSWNVFIQDFDPHPTDALLRARQVEGLCATFRPKFDVQVAQPPPLEWSFPRAEVVIGDDVWIGANVTILKGVTIGQGCIVATGAVVVAGEYPSFSLIAGNPAKTVKTLTSSFHN